MKTAVITGGNSGIGKATAMQLAQKGYRVIIHGREPEKTKAAAEEIKLTTGNSQIDYVIADVSTISGMRELAKAIQLKTDVIHSLVLSTGVILPKQIITSDGLEAGFVIQYLSRFAVTHLLINELKRGKAKIVHVGASVLPGAKIHFDNITLQGEFTMVKAMAQEMFANHLFVQEFAKRHASAEMIMNMGEVGVANTGITRNMNFFVRLGIQLVGKSPAKSAKKYVQLVTDEAVDFSGYFINSNGNINKKSKISFDPKVAAQLWELSLKLINPVL